MQSVYYFSVCFFLFSHIFPSSHGKLAEKIENLCTFCAIYLANFQFLFYDRHDT